MQAFVYVIVTGIDAIAQGSQWLNSIAVHILDTTVKRIIFRWGFPYVGV